MSGRDRGLALQQTIYESRNPTRRYLHQSRRRWVEGVLQQQPAVSIALEIGVGSGVYLASLAACAQTVVALDSRAVFLAAARDSPQLQALGSRLSFVRGDLQAPPLAAGSVDLLLCSEVIEHLAESANVLQSMVGLLSPGGRLVLTTPQAFSPLELLGKVAFLPGVIQLLRWIYREPVEATGHINLRTAGELARQLSAAGLEICQEECLGLYLPGIAEFGGAWGQRLLARLETPLRRSPLRFLLWTQCYVLVRQSTEACAKR